MYSWKIVMRVTHQFSCLCMEVDTIIRVSHILDQRLNDKKASMLLRHLDCEGM